MNLIQVPTKKHSLIACAAVSLLLSACATTPAYQETIVSQYKKHQITLPQPLTPSDRADLVEAVISADLAFQQQDYVTATSYYLFAAQMTQSAELIQSAVQSARLAGDDLGLQQAAELWVEQAPENTEALITLIIADLKTQNLDLALQHTLRMLNTPHSQEQAYQWLSRIILASPGRVALTYLSQLNQDSSDIAAVTLTQAKLLSEWAAQTRDPQQTLNQALSLTKKALNNAPQMESAVELYTQLLFRLNREEEAEAFLREQLAARPDSGKTAELLGHLLYDLRKFRLAISHYKPWLDRHPEDWDARYYLAASYYALQDYENSLQSFRELLDKDFEADTVAYYCGDSARRLKQLAQAKACFALVRPGRFYIPAQMELARILAKEGQFDQAMELLRKAETRLAQQNSETDPEATENQQTRLILEQVSLLENYRGVDQALARLQQALTTQPDNLALLFRQMALQKLESDAPKLVARLNQIRQLLAPGEKRQKFERAAGALLFNNGHHREAVDWVTRALQESTDDKELLYAKAIYLEPLGRFDEMITIFKQLLELTPNNINVMNALGYTLVDLNRDLDYAARLIQKAYAAAPDNAAIVDSMGWLAYRQGKLDEAVKYLKKSYQLNPSAEVATHLGEVLWESGKKQDALQVWQQARRMDASNYLLQKTLKRFKVKLEPAQAEHP